MSIIDKTDLSRGLHFEQDVMSTLSEGLRSGNTIFFGVTDNPDACYHEVLEDQRLTTRPDQQGQMILVHESRDLSVAEAELNSLVPRLDRLLRDTSCYRVALSQCCPPKPGASAYFIYAWVA